MPNWCETNVYIKHEDSNAIKYLCGKLEEWTNKNYMENGFGHKWLGNVVLGAEVGTVDTDPKTDLWCRGRIEDISCNDNEISIYTDTAWSPILGLWIKVVEKYIPGAELTYVACEPGCEVYFTDDPDLIGTYNIDPYDNEEVDYCFDASEKEVAQMLQKLLKTDESNIDVLLEKFEESDYSGDIGIHQWEYVNPAELD